MEGETNMHSGEQIFTYTCILISVVAIPIEDNITDITTAIR